ncbi:neurotrimin-like [Macrosteles quadrilineatus]|uniref:neurotrimin-like n=1 Tax=Macrosteles quadrilineatus TaxID=74068 RepID=UPI0023E31418|nr:neurotrimin-like [Macrosteles quadrilineatus]
MAIKQRRAMQPRTLNLNQLCLSIFPMFLYVITICVIADVPRFGEPIINVTAPVGREATLVCVVDDLGSYKVAWLRVDTQTILTIHNHVITKNHRVGVTHSDHRTWMLHVREIRSSDRGWYMCQINTDPMKSQVGFLDVVVPPDILDSPTSTDMVVREGSPVTLRCAASGSPAPNITWRREGGEPIPLTTGQEAGTVEGSMLNISRVNRLHMGAYLCIASNGVPPSVSKRIMLTVHFPPMIWIQNQLIGSREGQQLILECHSEAYPKSINYWTKGDKGEIIAQGAKYEPVLVEHLYKVIMRLTIKSLGPGDYGAYKCVSKNSLGDTDGTIKVYPVLSDNVSTMKPRHKDKNRLRPKYGGQNEIGDSGGLAKQRELKVGAYDDLSDDEESSAPSLHKTILAFIFVFPFYLTTL